MGIRGGFSVTGSKTTRDRNTRNSGLLICSVVAVGVKLGSLGGIGDEVGDLASYGKDLHRFGRVGVDSIILDSEKGLAARDRKDRKNRDLGDS